MLDLPGLTQSGGALFSMTSPVPMPAPLLYHHYGYDRSQQQQHYHARTLPTDDGRATSKPSCYEGSGCRPFIIAFIGPWVPIKMLSRYTSSNAPRSSSSALVLLLPLSTRMCWPHPPRRIPRPTLARAKIKKPETRSHVPPRGPRPRLNLDSVATSTQPTASNPTQSNGPIT